MPQHEPAQRLFRCRSGRADCVTGGTTRFSASMSKVSVSTEAATLWDSLREFRNNLVHSLEVPVASEIDRRNEELRRLVKILEQRSAQQGGEADDASPRD